MLWLAATLAEQAEELSVEAPVAQPSCTVEEAWAWASPVVEVVAALD